MTINVYNNCDNMWWYNLIVISYIISEIPLHTYLSEVFFFIAVGLPINNLWTEILFGFPDKVHNIPLMTS